MTETATVLGKRILLVDDDPGARESIKLLLSIDRHTVAEAASGREALERFNKGSFDLVITDYLMPEMHGNQLAMRIRSIAPAQPILMVTGYYEQVAGLENPVDEILGKPFGVRELRRAIARPINRMAPPGLNPAANEAPEPSFEGLGTRATETTILLREILNRRRPGSPPNG
jgi:DNA-binding response OmpR family regulator